MERYTADSLQSEESDSIPPYLEEQLSRNCNHDESMSSLDERGRTQTEPIGEKIEVYKKTISIILSLYLIGTLQVQPIKVTFADLATALLCSILHYIFFDQLHGSIANGDDASISQSYATVVSLLLVTIFKASLLGCVGICSVQYLWRVLRGQPIAMSTVESLFQMRHNPLELFYSRTIISVSFLVAAYTWIVPLATIYPPGALTVNATPFLLTKSVHMSVPELRFDSKFNPLQPENVSRLANFAGVAHRIDRRNNNHMSTGTINVTTNLQAMWPQASLIRLSKSVIAAGEIVLKPSATLGDNSTYTLEFMGPQLSCRKVEQFNRTIPGSGAYFTDLVLGEANRSRSQGGNALAVSAMDNAYREDKVYEWQIVQQNKLGGTPCQNSQGDPQTLDENGARSYEEGIFVGAPPNGTYSRRHLIETTKTNCTERYVRYIANITYSKGIRSIQYTMRDIEPQPVKDLSIVMIWEASNSTVSPGREWQQNASIDAAFAASPYFQRSRDYLKEKFLYWNAFTIYAAFLDTIESATNRYCYVATNDPNGPRCNAEWTRSDGSRVAFGPVICPPVDRCKYIDDRLSRTAKPVS
jgi:hypothetical protein